MKQIVHLLFCIFSVFHILGQVQKTEPLIYVTKKNKIGFIDFNGKEIIPIKFDAVKWFSEDILPVNKGGIESDFGFIGGKWGFWKNDGKEIIPLKYDNAKILREGLAPVQLNQKYGFINKNDEAIIDFIYDDAQPFKEGLAAIKLKEKWGFIDKNGNIIIPPTFDKVRDFDNNFSVVFHLINHESYEDDGYLITKEEGKYGLIDKKGILKLDTVYEHIDNYVNGFAKISMNGKEGFIDSTGKIAIPIQYDKVENFSEGLAAVANYMIRDSYHDFGYTKQQIDSLEKEVEKLLNGNIINYNEVINHPTFQEFQRAKIQQPSEKLTYGYINTNGELIIDYQFDNAEPFQNGLAKIRFGLENAITFTYTDTDGNTLPSYQEQIGLGANLIDTSGKLQLHKNQQFINRYEDSIYVTYNYKGAGAYYNAKRTIMPHQYDNLKYIGDGFFVGELKNSQDKLLLGNNINLRLNDKYFDIEYATSNAILVNYIIKKKQSYPVTKYGIMNTKGEWIVKSIYDFAMVW